MKRCSYINWFELGMGAAYLAACRSKDPSTQVGAAIMKDHVIIGTGYNGMPNGCSDDDMNWGKEGDYLDTKYPYVVHAEPNAILNSSVSTKGGILFVSLFPCNECAKIIVQAGIVEVVYVSDKYADLDFTKAAKIIFEKSPVKTTKYVHRVPNITWGDHL